MTIAVAEKGLYDQMYVVGVYDSVERAIGDLHRPGDVWTRHREAPDAVWWENDKDWDSYIRIYEMEITDNGPLQQPDKATSRVTPDPNGRVVYLDEPV